MARFLAGFVALALALGLPAADVPAAEANLRRVEALVEAGALPRSALKAAQERLQDARHEQLLRQTLYGGNVTPEDVPGMLNAASELWTHARNRLTAQQELVKQGVAAARSLEPFEREHDLAKQQWELAQSSAALAQKLAAMARREAELEESVGLDLVIRSAGKGTLTDQDFFRVETAFYRRFSQPLPVSARGSTAVHRSLGFDHRDRYDVALNPDQEEGRWLINLLRRLGVPYIGFRRAKAGQATGAHIHIGLPSPRLVAGA